VQLLNHLKSQVANHPNPRTQLQYLVEQSVVAVQNAGKAGDKSLPTSPLFHHMPILAHSRLLKEWAGEHFAAKRYPEAIDGYITALRALLSDKDSKLELPSPHFINPTYMDLTKKVEEDGFGWIMLIEIWSLAGNIAQCYHNLGEHFKVCIVLDR